MCNRHYQRRKIEFSLILGRQIRTGQTEIGQSFHVSRTSGRRFELPISDRSGRAAKYFDGVFHTSFDVDFWHVRKEQDTFVETGRQQRIAQLLQNGQADAKREG